MIVNLMSTLLFLSDPTATQLPPGTNNRKVVSAFLSKKLVKTNPQLPQSQFPFPSPLIPASFNSPSLLFSITGLWQKHKKRVLYNERWQRPLSYLALHVHDLVSSRHQSFTSKQPACS